MFDFNEELFVSASQKVEDSILAFIQKKSFITELNNLAFNYDFKEEVNTICNDLNNIQNTIVELGVNIAKTKKILNIIDNSIFSKLATFDLSTILSNSLFDRSSSLDFLNDGQYGANQSGPIILLQKAQTDYDSLSDVEKKQYQDLLKVFKKYGYINQEGNWNKSMYQFMQAAQSGGCGFAANTNIIIDIYYHMENGNEIFMQKYEFPLYYENSSGEKIYNYDALFASHYLDSVDKFSQQVIPGVNISIPSFWPKWNPSMITSFLDKGSIEFQRQNALSNAFDDVSFENTSFNGNFESLIEHSSEFDNHDYAVIEAHNFTLESLDGNSISFDAGHFMLITDVNEDGNYIVSSWGKQYILKNVQLGNLSFVDVRR